MKRPTIVLIILLCWSRFAAAQIQQASIEGTVVDSSGLAVPGAIIELLDPATSQTRSLATDSAGTFRFTNIPPGTYVLRAELSGFATYEQRDLALTVAQLARLSIVLTPASVAETVTVTAQVPLLDPSRTAGMSTVVDTERIEELPVRSRNYLEFTLLAPGVAPSQPGGRAPSTTSMADSGFSFAGLRPRSNLLTIDGLDNNDEVSGASRTELSLEIVREFQVVSNGWSAENGGASGGAINVVTKSGANTLHGDAFLFGQSGRLNALPKLEDLFGARPSLTRYRGGLAIGGPIARDRTFYYAAAEQEYTRGEAAADTGLGTPSTINAFLASGHLSRLATRELTLGLAPTALDETELSAKLTHQINSRHSVVARIAGTNTDERGDAFNSGGLSDASARGSSRTHDVALTGDWTGTLTSRITNDVRGQYATRRVARNTGDSAGPGMVVPGVAEFGRPYAGNDQNDQTYAEISDTLAVASRHHFVKAGATVTHVGVTVNGVDGLGGLYVFPTLNALLAGQPDSYRQTFAPPSATLATLRTGVFVQDHWTPRSALSFDLGVRFDASALPSALDITNRQVSPRIGVAWTPAEQWVVRAGAGTFADRIVLASLVKPLVLDGRAGFEQIVEGAAAGAALSASAGGPAVPLSNIPASIYTARSGDWHPSSQQASVGIERGLSPDLTASLTYVYVRGRDLPRAVNVNLPAPVTQDGRAVFGPARLDPTRNDIFELQPTAASAYHGVTATLNRRLANEFEWTASYTWAHATDTASDYDEQPQNPYALEAERADSRYDERHRVVASALFDLPIGDEEDRKPGEVPAWWERAFSNIELAPIFTYGSGRAVNPVVGLDASHSDAYPLVDRPLGYERNGLRLPASATLDLRLLKAIPIRPHGKLDLVIEAFNVLNRTNVTQLNTVYGPLTSPLSFTRAIEAAAARHIQFSIDFEF